MPESLPIYQVDAFADRLFAGNPAAVCPLDAWLPDVLMQRIAAENNLSETAFVVPEGELYRIRWFTPAVEVDLCGHATLAAAYVLFHELGHEGECIRFASRSGLLTVRQESGGWLALDFPAAVPEPCTPPSALIAGLGVDPVEVRAAEDWLVVLQHEAQVASLQPQLTVLHGLPRRGVIVTAPGADCDFVSRFFAPNCGIDEDPVTGSAHCLLTPYWAERLGRAELMARQISARSGTLRCRLDGGRVHIAGAVCLYLCGRIALPADESSMLGERMSDHHDKGETA